jgi:hypothetical protein
MKRKGYKRGTRSIGRGSRYSITGFKNSNKTKRGSLVYLRGGKVL